MVCLRTKTCGKIISTMVLTIFLLPAPLLSGQLYMWVDERGVTCITDRPPPEDEYLQKEIHYREKSEAELRDARIREQRAVQRIDRMIERDEARAARNRVIRKYENAIDQERRDRERKIKFIEKQMEERRRFETWEDSRRKQDEAYDDIRDRMDRRSDLYREQRRERMKFYDNQ